VCRVEAVRRSGGGRGDGGPQPLALRRVVRPPGRLPERTHHHVVARDADEIECGAVHFEHEAIGREQTDELEGAVDHHLEALLAQPQLRDGGGAGVRFRGHEALAFEQQREPRRDQLDEHTVGGGEGRAGIARQLERAHGATRGDERQAQHALGAAGRAPPRDMRGDGGVGLEHAARRLDERAEPREERRCQRVVVGGRHGAGGEFNGGGEPTGIEVFEGLGHGRAGGVYPDTGAPRGPNILAGCLPPPFSSSTTNS
jgi:hypothetical protein